VTIELRPSTDFSVADLAVLFTASYEGYAVPLVVDASRLAFMVDAFDLDRSESLVAVEDGTPVGLANLGRRGATTWLGGIGVVPSSRRRGLGELLTRRLLDRAREIGAREMLLEVIVENAPAIALYEKLGFERTRDLEVLSLPPGDGGASADEIAVAAARRLIADRRQAPEPWQRADETLVRLARREPPLRALAAGEAAAVYRPDGGRLHLLQAAGDPPGLRAVVAALRARGPLYALNFPAGGAVAVALREAGAELVVRQHEMAAAL
jgi:GNAT superfamily N-acetyltransferase